MALWIVVGGCFFAPPRPAFRDGGETTSDGDHDGGVPPNANITTTITNARTERS